MALASVRIGAAIGSLRVSPGTGARRRCGPFIGPRAPVNRGQFAVSPDHVMPFVMGDARALDAIARIERALARIETAGRRSGTPAADTAELGELRRAHQALRARVEGAIGEIDRLLESEAR